jgi:arabinofuranosyltransferase
VTAAPPIEHRSSLTTWLVALSALGLLLCVQHIWIVDDAFITLRQVQQLLLGNGFVWNQGERVQAYTHPLWALLMIPAFALTHEGFWTLAALSLLVTIVGTAFALRWLGRSGEPWRMVAFLLLLLPSKAFFDFTSSGLENCLTHALVVATYGSLWVWLERADMSPAAHRRRFLLLCLLVGATYLNRADTLLLVAPALVVGALHGWRPLRLRLLGTACLGFLPVAAWTAWTLLYYGRVIPNTAVAKIIGARLTTGERIESGLLYAVDSTWRDPYTLTLAAIAMVLLLSRRRAAAVAAAVGIGLYLTYVVVLGAAGTHMSGRFFSSVVCLAAFALARSQVGTSAAACFRLLVVVALASFLVPSAPLRAIWQPGSFPFALTAFQQTFDTRSYVAMQGASLFSYRRGLQMPDHAWYRAGLAFADSDERVHVGGLGDAGGADAIGYSGFAAGPDKYLIDHMGLADALLARLPLPEGAFFDRPGHVRRALPAGYLESCRTGENRIEDPDLHAYYDKVRLVISGPLWSWQRLRTIVAWNLGSYDEHLARYAERAGLRRVR